MRNQRITDTDAAAVVGGTAPAGHPELADVATALSELRVAAFESLPQPSAALRERLERGAPEGSVARLPEENTRARAGGVRRMLAGIAGLGLAVKIVLGATVAVAAVGGAGVAGVLPGPAQEVFNTVVAQEEPAPILEPVVEPSPTPSVDPGSEPAEDTTDDDTVEGPAEGENFGSYVSDEAKNKEGTGREFGEQISDLAKENGNGNKPADEPAPDSVTEQDSGKSNGGGTGGKKR